jgi:hypothetical protein
LAQGSSFASEATLVNDHSGQRMPEHQSEIEHAIQNDLTPEDRAALERGNELFKEKAKGRDLDDWLIIAIGHNVRVRLARRLAKTNKRNGAIYNKYLHHLMQHDGIDTADKRMMGNLTALTWLSDDEHPDRLVLLAEARAKMTPGELVRLNSPHTARSLVNSLLAGTGEKKSEVRPISRTAKLVEENRTLTDTILVLEERLASAEAGSIFDRSDEAKSVVAVIVRSQFSLGKLKAIEEGIRAYRLEHAKDTAPLPKVKVKS